MMRAVVLLMPSTFSISAMLALATDLAEPKCWSSAFLRRAPGGHDLNVTGMGLDRELGDRRAGRKLLLDVSQLAANPGERNAGIDQRLDRAQRGQITKRQLGRDRARRCEGLTAVRQ